MFRDTRKMEDTMGISALRWCWYSTSILMACLLSGGAAQGYGRPSHGHSSHGHSSHSHHNSHHHSHYSHNRNHTIHYGYRSYGVPSVIVTNQVPTNVAPAFQGVGMVVTNPTANGGAIRFTIDSQSYTLEPGYYLTLTTQPSYSITFGSGAGTDTKSYALSDGKAYNFSPKSGQWNLAEKATVAVQSGIVTAANTVDSKTSPTIVQTSSLKVTEDAPAAVPQSFVKGTLVQVAVGSTDIRNGPTVMKTVSQGTSFKVLDVQGKWVMVDFGGAEYGWIKSADLREGSPTDDDAPVGVKK